MVFFSFSVYVFPPVIIMSDSTTNSTLPVFIKNNNLPAFETKEFSTAELCAAAERASGHNSIEGAQRIGGLWRVYPATKEGRHTLLIGGFVVRGVQVSVTDKNPFIVLAADGRQDESPSTKVTVSNIPLSFSDMEISKAVHSLGVELRSKVILERDRDSNGKLTRWKTGRRFLYITTPPEPLPRTVSIGPFKATLYHREQAKRVRQLHAECGRCFEKSHSTAQCPNPVKCKQCLKDNHKAGDPDCDMTPVNNMPPPHPPPPPPSNTSTQPKAPERQRQRSPSTSPSRDRGRSRTTKPKHISGQRTLHGFSKRDGSSAKRQRSRSGSPQQNMSPTTQNTKQARLSVSRTSDNTSDANNDTCIRPENELSNSQGADSSLC